MLRLVSKNETRQSASRSDEHHKGMREGLARIAGLTAKEEDRSLDELRALLQVFEWSVIALKRAIRIKEKQAGEFKLTIVK